MNKKIVVVISALILSAVAVAVTVIMNHNDNDTIQSGELRVNFIDVGKGDCILIQSASHTMMIDTGYEDTTENVFDFLNKENVTKIDKLVLTHYDKDHIGGAKELLSVYSIEKVYIPNYEKDSKAFNSLISSIENSNLNFEYVSDNVSFSCDNANYTIMPSGVAYDSQEENDNDMSLLVSVVYSDDSYLFAGDIEKDGINQYLSRDNRTYDVLKIPHHGRLEKNSKDFLDSVNPIYAVITDDAENEAESELCALLDSAGVIYYRTKENGTITIKGNGTGIYNII